MAKILKDSLPQPGQTYKFSTFNQLIRKLQLILGLDVHTKTDADETEAINFFLSN